MPLLPEHELQVTFDQIVLFGWVAGIVVLAFTTGLPRWKATGRIRGWSSEQRRWVICMVVGILLWPISVLLIAWAVFVDSPTGEKNRGKHSVENGPDAMVDD